MRGALWAAAILVSVVAGARAGEPMGPVFGNNSYSGEIRGEGEPDADDFVGPLVAGERLTVSVRAEGEGSLLPALAILDPSGADRTPPARAGTAGRAVSVRSFVSDRTGRWVVRVSGREGSEGGYTVRFRVRPPRHRTTTVRFDEAPAPRVESVPFEAARGGSLSLRISPVPAEGLLPLVEILDPDGGLHPIETGLADRRGGALRLRGQPLDGPDGTWRLLVGVEGGPLAVSLRADPPERRRGTTVLDRREPRLDPREEPIPVHAGGMVRLEGAGFSRSPLPRVRIGDVPAPAVRAGDLGESLDVLLPPLPRGVPLPVSVANPDGQACAAEGHVLVLPPGPPGVITFSPESLRVEAGTTATVGVVLSGFAPEGGTDVALEADPGIGTVPASVRVPGFSLAATFPFRAGAAAGTGRIRATLGNSIVLPVTVFRRPDPDVPEIDLSGWRLVQTDAARSWTLPAGTRLPAGGVLLVSRKSPRAGFEAFWRTTLGADVVFLDSGDRIPLLNGDETLSLFDAEGTLVDGPTIPVEAGKACRRLPGKPAGDGTSWECFAAVPGTFVPGAAAAPPSGPIGVWIAAFADPPGSGQYVHEFVEIRWDGTER